MAAHGIWNGSISFGLVTIPVTLRPAIEEREMKFTMLDKKDLAPVGYKHVNKKSGKEVKWENIVKGYEYTEDKYVVMEPEDFRKANVKANQLLEIEDFVALDEVDPVYLDKPYYVVPTAQGAKAYNLLRDALKHTKKIGIGRVVLHTKYRLVAILPMDNLLLLEILRFPHELRPGKDLDVSASQKRSKASPREVAIAEQIISGMTSAWNPKKYKDTYHDDLLRLIHQKIKRGATAEIEAYNEPEETADEHGKILDLMPLLKASLARGHKSAAGKTKTRAVRKPARSAARQQSTSPRARRAAGSRRP